MMIGNQKTMRKKKLNKKMTFELDDDIEYRNNQRDIEDALDD